MAPLLAAFAAKVLGALVALWLTFRIARAIERRLSAAWRGATSTARSSPF